MMARSHMLDAVAFHGEPIIASSHNLSSQQGSTGMGSKQAFMHLFHQVVSLRGIYASKQSYICQDKCQYDPMIPRPIQTLGFSLITWLIPSPSPTLRPHLSPVNQRSSSVHTTHTFWVTPDKLLPKKGSHCSNLQSLGCTAVPQRNINAKHIYWSGNQFQGHSHHIPLPPNHLRLMILNLPLHQPWK